MSRAPRGLINLSALSHNYHVIKKAAPNSCIMSVVKSNGYGHGLLRVARALEQTDAYAVACIDEAIQLRQAGFAQTIVLLEGFHEADELEIICEMGFELVLHHEWQLDALIAYACQWPQRIWVKLDTGMGRIGFSTDKVLMILERLLSANQFEAENIGWMTHLANADDRNDQQTVHQLERFESALEGVAGPRSIANSAGTLGWPKTHADWVRPGLALYGASPFVDGLPCEYPLKPVMTLKSKLMSIRRFSKGDRVSYGGTWECPEAMPIGIVAIGYGDGYPRHAQTGTPVLINGVRVPIVGRVTMDMICVDLRELPDAKIGDEAVLWGEGLPAEEIAGHCNTISYELFCKLTARVQFEEC